MSDVLTIREVAALYRCSPSTIRRAIQAGELDHVRVLGVIRVPRSALPAALTDAHASTLAVSDAPRGSAAAAGASETGEVGSPIHAGAGEQSPTAPTPTHGGSN